MSKKPNCLSESQWAALLKGGPGLEEAALTLAKSLDAAAQHPEKETLQQIYLLLRF